MDEEYWCWWLMHSIHYVYMTVTNHRLQMKQQLTRSGRDLLLEHRAVYQCDLFTCLKVNTYCQSDVERVYLYTRQMALVVGDLFLGSTVTQRRGLECFSSLISLVLLTAAEIQCKYV